MKAGIRFSSTLGCLVLVFTCMGCDGAGTAVSDVPCLRAPAWPAGVGTPYVRAAADGSDVLLVTGQTPEQFLADFDDGVQDFRPHSAVYRLDPEVGSFELVDDRVWDDSDGEVILVSGSGPASPTFGIAGFFSPRLNFHGSSVAVAGGNALSVVTSPTRAAAAMLSSAGYTPGVAFVNSGFGTGQHYHQLFSETDGSPLGDPVRVGVGDALVVGNWTEQEDYVVYWQRAGGVGPGETTLCAVPVTEDLPPLEGE